MSRILMVDYYGACDRQGKAVGHSPKAAREYRTLFSEKDEVDLAVSPVSDLSIVFLTILWKRTMTGFPKGFWTNSGY